MTPRWALPPVLLLLWLALLLLSVATRPLLPVDETRYLGVAWEMWRRGDFLVPYLNGVPYSDKPPLYFWLMHGGWWFFGVNEWWPRSVAALLSLVALWATARLSARLWPEDILARRLVPWVLFGCIVWTAFYTWVQFDMPLVLFSLLAMIGLVAAAGRRRGGWWLVGLGLGLGGLSKGPVILLHVLPTALLAPVWVFERPCAWWRWYAGIGGSVLLGTSIALAWVLPAVHVGGADYAQALLWGQTAGRVVSAFAHAHPGWWYLIWLPVLFAPWLLLPWVWRPLLRTPRDSGVQFCLAWLLSTLLLMSLMSGKQLKYLLPMLPAFALLVARVLSLAEQQGMTRRPLDLAALVFLSGISLAAAPLLLASPRWMASVSPLWGVAVIAAAVPLAAKKSLRPAQYPIAITIVSAGVLAIVYLGVFGIAAPAYDLRAASRVIAAAQAAGRPVASLAEYHGQFGFYGRLSRPVEYVPPAEALAWASKHPQGYVIAYYRGPVPGHPAAVFDQPYRGGHLAIWEARALAADPARLP